MWALVSSACRRVLLIGLALGHVHAAVWTAISPLPQSKDLKGVVYGNNQFVAVGSQAIVTSSNGLSWTNRSAGIIDDLNDVTFLSGIGYVAVGEKGAILSSTNGVAWSSKSSGITSRLTKVASSANSFVALSPDDFSVVLSSDGTTWTGPDPNGGLDGSSTPNDLAASPDLFVVVGNDGTIQTSADGHVWDFQNSGISENILAIAYTGANFIALTYTSALISSDGINWTVTANDLNNTGITNLVPSAFNGPVLAVKPAASYSFDAVDWGLTFPSDKVFFCGAFGQNNFVLAGSNGKIVTHVSSFPAVTTFPSTVSVVFSQQQQYVNEGGQVTFSLVRSGDLTGTTVVHFSTDEPAFDTTSSINPIEASPGTAYAPVHTDITFNPFETTKTVQVNTINDLQRISARREFGGVITGIEGVKPILLDDCSVGILDQQAGLRFAGLTNLAVNILTDQSSDFSGDITMENPGTMATHPVRLRLFAQSGSSYRQQDGSLPETTVELGSYDVGNSISAGGRSTLFISDNCPAPVENVGGTFSGLGWWIYAQLEEQVLGNWYGLDRWLLLEGVWPQVAGFNGPGGGVLRLDPCQECEALGNYSPIITGPATINEGTAATYVGLIADSHQQPVSGYTSSVKYAVSGNAAIIDQTTGKLTALQVLANTTVKVSATFTIGGKQFTVQAQVLVKNINYTITAKANSSAKGVVYGSGNYGVGKIVYVKAIAKKGRTFVSWTENGKVVSSKAVLSFVANRNRILVANFK